MILWRFVIYFGKKILKDIMSTCESVCNVFLKQISSRTVFQEVDSLILNKAEFLSLLEKGDLFIDNRNLFRLLKKARKKFNGNIILTLGDKELVLFDKGDNFSKYQAFPVKPVGVTTGGDAFVAGFVFGLYKKRSLSDSIIITNAVRALAVSKAGAQSFLPYKDEIETFLRGKGFNFFS